MGSTWFSNLYLGTTMPDRQLREIPLPMTELLIHVGCKTVETFSLLGMTIVGPASFLLSRKAHVSGSALSSSSSSSLLSASSSGYALVLRSFISHCGRCGAYGAALGLPVAPLMTWLVVGSLSPCRDPNSDHYDAVYDRAYRLRYNGTQVRCDRFATLGGIGGALLGYGLYGSPVLGTVLGMNLGVVLSTALGMTAGPPKYLEPRGETVVMKKKREGQSGGDKA